MLQVASAAAGFVLVGADVSNEALRSLLKGAVFAPFAFGLVELGSGAAGL